MSYLLTYSAIHKFQGMHCIVQDVHLECCNFSESEGLLQGIYRICHLHKNNLSTDMDGFSSTYCKLGMLKPVKLSDRVV